MHKNNFLALGSVVVRFPWQNNDCVLFCVFYVRFDRNGKNKIILNISALSSFLIGTAKNIKRKAVVHNRIYRGRKTLIFPAGPTFARIKRKTVYLIAAGESTIAVVQKYRLRIIVSMKKNAHETGDDESESKSVLRIFLSYKRAL